MVGRYRQHTHNSICMITFMFLRTKNDEFYSKQTKDRKKIPAGRGKPHVGVIPYGYDRLRGILIVNGKEIETVRLILKLW